MEKVRNICHLITYSLTNKLTDGSEKFALGSFYLFFFLSHGDLLNYFGGRLSETAGLVSVLNHSSADVETWLVQTQTRSSSTRD